MKISILFIITGLNTGGAEMMLYKLLSHMDRSRFSPVVVSLREEGPVAQNIRSLGIEVIPLDVLSPRNVFRGLRGLRKTLSEHDIHIIQGWMDHGNLVSILIGMTVRRHIPVLWNVRQALYSLRYEKRMSAAVIKLGGFFSRLPYRIIYNSQVSARQHAAIGYASARQVIIPNGFDIDLFRPSPEASREIRFELGLPQDAFLIGLVGRYHPMKDHATFLRASSLVSRNHPDIRFVLAGDNVDKKNGELMRLTSDLGLLEKVHFLGRRDDVPRITAALDIAACSSFTEGFPNVVGEAMSCGVPCVVTDVGDTARLVGDTGRVVLPRDPQAFAGALEWMIAAGDEKRKELGLKARQRIIDMFSIQNIARQYEKLYEAAFNAQQAGR
jgi:glycosyltransferase involved in cell wall biosynthesis